jgi:hypothetical protein
MTEVNEEEELIQKVDLAPFLAALIFEAGGSIDVNYETLVDINNDSNFIAMDMNDEGTVLTLRLVTESEIPEDVRPD